MGRIEEHGRSENSEDDESHRLRLLELLDAQCRQNTGIAVGGYQDSDIEMAEAEEWTGIQEDSAEEDELALRETTTPVIFYEAAASTSKRKLDDVLVERDTFMSSKIRGHVAAIDAEGRRRARSGIDEQAAEEEHHLQQLDASLLSLIKDLPSSSSTSTLLPKLQALPNPRHTTRKERQAPIDKRAPRQLREALYTSRLSRARQKAAEEKEFGIISHKRDITKRGGDFAITKKERREQKGEEGKRRKKAKGLGSVVGKMKKGGSILTLNRDEITKGNEGDLEGLLKRKRGQGIRRGAGRGKVKGRR